MGDYTRNAGSVVFIRILDATTLRKPSTGNTNGIGVTNRNPGGLLGSALDIIASEPHNHGLRMECSHAARDRSFVHVERRLNRVETHHTQADVCNWYEPASVSDCLHNIYKLTSKLNATRSTRDQRPLTSAAM